MEADTSLSGWRVRRVLDRITGERGRPEAIVVDNGPKFRGRAMESWSEQRGVRLKFIEPGKPVQNAFIESFNGRLRDECLRDAGRGLEMALQHRASAQLAQRSHAERIRGPTGGTSVMASFALEIVNMRTAGTCQGFAMPRPQ